MIKKLFVSLLLITGLIAGLLFASISLIDYNKISREFTEFTKIDSSSIKAGDFTMEKFPSLSLSIRQIEQDGKVVARNASIHFSLMSLLIFDPQITEIRIGEVMVYLDSKDISVLNHDKFFTELITRKILDTKASIDRLIFVGAASQTNPLVVENFRSIAASGGKISFVGNVDGIGEITAAVTQSGDDMSLKLEARDDYTNLSLEENYKNGTLEGGKFFIESSRLAYKISQCIPDFAMLSQKLNSNKQIKVTFDIVPTTTYMGLKNIVINSDCIVGSGEVDLGKDDMNISEVKLNFTKIDLSAWQNDDNVENQNFVDNYAINKNFDFQKNPMSINIFAQDIKLGGNNSLSDLNVQGNIKDGKLYIQNFTGNIGSDGKFQINGVVTQNSFRSLFEGKIVFNHRDLNDLAAYFGGENVRTGEAIPFTFSADVKMSSVDISLQNLLIKTKDTDLMGSISTKYIGDSPRTNATFRISEVNIDQKNFPAISQVFEYAIGLFDGMKNNDYLNRFIPIRKINMIGNYDITFDKLTAWKTLYKNLSFDLALSPGKIAFERLSIQNGDDWIDTSITLDAEGIKPLIYFNIHDASLAVNFLSPAAMLELRKEIIDKFDPSKLDIMMKFYLTKLYDGDFSLGRVYFQARNDKNLLDIKQFDADLLGGRLQSSGSILLDPYTLNFVYALNSAHVDEIAKLLPENMLESGGVISASGMLSTRGDKLDAQLYNLYTKSNLLAKAITIQDFSVDDLIVELSRENYDLSNFKEDLKKALLTNKTEISDLKTSIELTKGVVTLSDLAFKTKYSAAVGSAVLNIYDFTVDANTILSFYLAKPQHGRSYTDYAPAKIRVDIKGNIFSPKKTANTVDLEELLKARTQQ
jgi:hypothetical protein